MQVKREYDPRLDRTTIGITLARTELEALSDSQRVSAVVTGDGGIFNLTEFIVRREGA